MSVEKIAKKIKLSVPETEEIFSTKINNFTLDRLMTYASRLFSPTKVKVIVGKEQKQELYYHA